MSFRRPGRSQYQQQRNIHLAGQALRMQIIRSICSGAGLICMLLLNFAHLFASNRVQQIEARSSQKADCVFLVLAKIVQERSLGSLVVAPVKGSGIRPHRFWSIRLPKTSSPSLSWLSCISAAG
jgi:hypothetical protein